MRIRVDNVIGEFQGVDGRAASHEAYRRSLNRARKSEATYNFDIKAGAVESGTCHDNDMGHPILDGWQRGSVQSLCRQIEGAAFKKLHARRYVGKLPRPIEVKIVNHCSFSNWQKGVAVLNIRSL